MVMFTELCMHYLSYGVVSQWTYMVANECRACREELHWGEGYRKWIGQMLHRWQEENNDIWCNSNVCQLSFAICKIYSLYYTMWLRDDQLIWLYHPFLTTIYIIQCKSWLQCCEWTISSSLNRSCMLRTLKLFI